LPGKKTDLAVAVAASGGHPVKKIAETLGVARSNLIEQAAGKRRKRGPQTRAGGAELTADIRRLVDTRPSYGYRRIAAILKRQRRAAGSHGRLRLLQSQCCVLDFVEATLKLTVTEPILELNFAFIIFYILTPPNTNEIGTSRTPAASAVRLGYVLKRPLDRSR
jgi:hypothetical protein